jgi:hypothetical protein
MNDKGAVQGGSTLKRNAKRRLGAAFNTAAIVHSAAEQRQIRTRADLYRFILFLFYVYRGGR